MDRPLTELLPLRGRRESQEPQVVMVPVEKMETEELLACRCVFWGSLLQACDGALSCAQRVRTAGPGRWGGPEFFTLLCHRGHQVCPALLDLKESLDPWGLLDR